MPFVIAPELATVAAAVLLTLLCIGVVYLLTAIARVLPKISFLFVHIDFGGIFSTITKPVVSLLTNAATGLMGVVESILRAMGWLFTELFDGIKDVLGVHAAQIAHIYNSVVPQAGSHAQSQATQYTNQQIATVGEAISRAKADFSHIAATDSAAEYAKAERSIGTVHSELVSALATGVKTAEAYADKHIAALQAHVERQVAAIPAPKTITRTLPGTTTTITRPVTTVVQGGTTTIIEGATVADLATVTTAVDAITSEFESCAVTTCEGPNNLQNLLQNALGIVDIAAAGAFLAEVINSPAAAEQDFAGIVQGLVSAGTTTFDALLSL